MHREEDKGKGIRFFLDLACVALVFLVLWFAFTLGISRGKYAVLFLGICFLISILKILAGGHFLGLKGRGLGAFSVLFICAFSAASLYLYAQYAPLLLYRAGAYNNVDILVGATIVVPLLLIIWKEGGLALAALIALFLLYFKFGNVLPGLFHHSGFSVKRIIEETILGFEGVYGIVLLTVSTWVSIFLIYAGIIRGFGTLDVIVKGCSLLFSKRRSLMPQIPVAASLIFGSFSGAATANVAGTGSFTISIMKRFGIPAKLAGAIESVASSGGQIMPPLMGATAFLMASFLGVSYLHIVAVGFLPAILFYLTLAFCVYWRTTKYVTDKFADSVESTPWTTGDWVKLLPLLLSVGVLFTRLAILTPMMGACLEGIAVYLVSQFLYELKLGRKDKSVWDILSGFGRSLINGIRGCAPSAASIGLIGGCMGLIVRVLTVTGLGPKLSSEMVDISHGFLPLLLFLTLLLCILFGMAVSTLAVYVLTTFVAAPALQEMGIPLLSTHFMIFYLGNMSMITPPVAPASLVASGIAGTSFIPTAWLATRLGLPLFLLGICFIYHPELLIWGPTTPIMAVITFVGLGGVASALHIPYESGRRSMLERVVLVLAAFATLFILNAAVYVPAAFVVVLLLVFRLRKAAKLRLTGASPPVS